MPDHVPPALALPFRALVSSWSALAAAAAAAWVHAATAAAALATRAAAARPGQRGQATAEYALVLLGCAAVALLVGAWATKTGKVGQLLDKVMESVLDKVK